MAKIALAFSWNVPGILVRGGRSIVAQGTAAGNAGVVVTAVGQAIQEVIGIVALIALLARRNVVLGFADGQFTVVAFAAASKDLLMIDSGHRGKIRIGVTGLTVIAGRDVIGHFAGRYHAIVTGRAVVDDAGVVEQRTCEAGGVVTGCAIVVCWNMRFWFASGSDREVAAVVAGDAVFADSLMIDGAAGKGLGGMAELATQGGGNVPLRFADRRHAMADVAVVDGAHVIKPGPDKTARSVAYATVLVGRQVLGRFALGEHAVVA